jgi:hypothetical protein
MSIEARREYLTAIRERYQNSTKKEKGNILKEFCRVCHYHRKHAIRILNGRLEPRMRKPGRRPVYGETFITHLCELWNAMGRLCSKNMVAGLPVWIPYYEPNPVLPDAVKQQLLKVSSATIDRLLKPYRTIQQRGLSTTKPTMWIKGRIPIELLHSKITEPGFIEADTVAHCGNSIFGEYANTLTVTDLFSAWTENRASWTKSAQGIVERVKEVEKKLPFTLQGFACDNGTEFINQHLEEYLTQRSKPIKFVRRRPYKKNDSAHVEQKNWTSVRQLFGYHRLDDNGLIPLMNEIYSAYWNPLLNYFTPSLKLIEKTRIGGKLKKKYDLPQTPYQRLINSEHLHPSLKARLKIEFQAKNPFTLKKELDRKLKIFFRLVEINKQRAA